jgi:6-phosphogluconolactonase
MRYPFKSQILASPEEAADRLAMDFIRYAEDALQYRDSLYIALSGGSTPHLMFDIISREYPKALKWERLHFFWVDERCVPHESSESNFGNANRLFFSKINIPSENLHPIFGNEDPISEAVRYTGEILTYVPCIQSIPAFDLVFLGMGNDGHTASIFPGQEKLFSSSSICSVSEHPQTGQKRITFTGKIINRANHVVLLVTGENKAEILQAVFDGSHKIYPVQQVKPEQGSLSWYIDKDAARLIRSMESH